MRGLSSIELSVIVNELGQITSSYFKNFYELKEDSFLITFSKERKETSVYINLAKTINETEFKEKTEAPTEFTLAARKKLDGSKVESIKQHGTDRIIIFEFLGREQKKMIVEMFDKGNLLIVNSDNIIELVYSGRSFKERSLRKGMVYVFPAQRGKTTQYSVEQEKSKELEPRIYEKKGEYLDFALMPMPKYKGDSEITERKFPTLSKLLDELYLKERTTEFNPEKSREAEEFRVSTDKLRKQIEEMKLKSEEYKKIANKIFENMNEINSVITHVRNNKVKSAEEMKSFGNINVKKVDPKKKTVTIEVD